MTALTGGRTLIGKHRASSPRPYAAVALIAAALLVAGAGAALSHPSFGGLGPSAAPAGDDRGGVNRPDERAGRAAAVSSTAPTAAVTAGPAPSAATVTAPATTAPPRPTPAPTRSVGRNERMEDEVTALVNQERAKAGCGVVRTDERLRTASRGHSSDMATNDYFSHTGRDGSSPWDRAKRAGYAQPIGENIAAGYRTAADVMRGWMNSPGHRANILNCDARATGTGLAFKPDGTPYWTQLFGRV